MVNESNNNEPKRHGGPAAILAKLLVRPSATVWGWLGMLAVLLVFQNLVDFLVDFSRAFDSAIWSLTKALLWGVCAFALLMAFRLKYRAEKRARLADLNSATPDQPVDRTSPASRGQALKFMLLQFVWALVSATVGLYFLASASSNSDINVWVVRVMFVIGVAWLGSLVIHVAWMGRNNIATFKFWGSWFAVNMLCPVVAIPIAMTLVPL